MILLKNFLNIFAVAELRKKVLFTLGILVVFRIGHHIPVIGIDTNLLASFMKGTGLMQGFFSYIDMFSGGGLSQGMLFAMGISPYITASIVMQFLSLSVPALEQLMKEGEYGRKVVNQYQRYLALGIAVSQTLGLAFAFENMGRLGQGPSVVLQPGWGFRLMFVLSLTVGSMFVMWLGEQISLFGIGNGTSMIIFAGIVSRFPADIRSVLTSAFAHIISWPMAFIILAVVVFMAGCIVFLEKGERKVLVQYARRVVGNRMFGGQSVYIPFKINPSGVMPVILASAALNIPYMLIFFLASRFTLFQGLAESFARGSLLYNVFEFVFIIAFSFFYTAIQFNPEELADNIKKSGGFIPGIRPGRKTAEYFEFLLTRVGLVGALYLAALALLPNIFQFWIGKNTGLANLSMMSGTALLIMVGVALETAAQVEAYLIEHNYEGFLSTGRLRGRGTR